MHSSKISNSLLNRFTLVCSSLIFFKFWVIRQKKWNTNTCSFTYNFWLWAILVFAISKPFITSRCLMSKKHYFGSSLYFWKSQTYLQILVSPLVWLKMIICVIYMWETAPVTLMKICTLRWKKWSNRTIFKNHIIVQSFHENRL